MWGSSTEVEVHYKGYYWVKKQWKYWWQIRQNYFIDVKFTKAEFTEVNNVLWLYEKEKYHYS